MISIVIITHGNFGEEMRKAAESIVGRQENVWCLHICSSDSPEVIQKKIEQALDKIQKDDGVIVFADMLGGSPCSMTLPYTKSHNIEIISGVNLYMLITAFVYRNKISQHALVDKIIDCGQKNICDVKKKLLCR